ncbi:MAG: hypothetical protein IPH54_22375 [Rhodoferax sp.]|nr:hypothetical protein [Rhodoferax sp.]
MVRLAIEMGIGLLVVILGNGAESITSPFFGKNAGKSAPPMLPKTELALGANGSGHDGSLGKVCPKRFDHAPRN